MPTPPPHPLPYAPAQPPRRRRRIALWSLLALATVATISAALLGPRPRRGTPTAPPAPPFSLPLLAHQFKTAGNPIPALRTSEIASALSTGKLAPADVDGIPLLARFIPAWWYDRPDVREVYVKYLGHPDKIHLLRLVHSDGRSVPLTPNHTSRQTLAEGITLFSCNYYFDERWNPLDHTTLTLAPSRPNQGLDYGGPRWPRLAQTESQWQLDLAGKRIPLEIPPQPPPVPPTTDSTDDADDHDKHPAPRP